MIGRDLDEKAIEFSRGCDGKLRANEEPVLDMIARLDQWAKARRMRDEGASFGDIAKALGISKSTASGWCHDLNGGQ